MTKKQSKFRVFKVVAYEIRHTITDERLCEYFITRGDAEFAAYRLNMAEDAEEAAYQLMKEEDPNSCLLPASWEENHD